MASRTMTFMSRGPEREVLPPAPLTECIRKRFQVHLDLRLMFWLFPQALSVARVFFLHHHQGPSLVSRPSERTCISKTETWSSQVAGHIHFTNGSPGANLSFGCNQKDTPLWLGILGFLTCGKGTLQAESYLEEAEGEKL